MAARERVDIHRQFFSSKPQRHKPARIHLKRGRDADRIGTGIGGVERRTCAGLVLVRQADAQRVTDLRAFLCVGVVVVAHAVADKLQLLMQDTQGFPGNHIRGEIDVSHWSLPF